ncbi:MAG: FixH family protein [Halothiobacillaceae bacterium]
MVTAPVGIALIVLSFFALKRLMPTRGRPIAVILGLVTLGIYVPFALRNWPGLDVMAMNIVLFLITIFALGLLFPGKGVRKKGEFHWGPTAIIAFLGTVIVVQAILFTVASHGFTPDVARAILPEPRSNPGQVTSFFPGEVPHAYQEKEALFNQYADQIRAQHERGWQVRQGWMGPAVLGEPAQYRLELVDAEGRPLDGARGVVRFMRAADGRLDFEAELRSMGQGMYGAEVVMPAPGRWSVLVELERGDDLHEVRAMTEVADRG